MAGPTFHAMKPREPDESTSYKEATTDGTPSPVIPGPPQETGTTEANRPRVVDERTDRAAQRERRRK